MNSLVNYYVIDPTNIGDRLSAPTNYFSFPEYHLEQLDIRQPETTTGKHLIVGGGGLLFPRFLPNISALTSLKQEQKLIAWGIGQQIYGKPKSNRDKIKGFDYAKYLNSFDLIGIRDFGLVENWVPCASCMHRSFDKKREIEHKFVVFSHKKFQLQIEDFPCMTNEVNDIEQVLDFLGSGETILTSSYHGAYWGTLLGRKVLVFPFASKFYTLKHQPAIYPVLKWKSSEKVFYCQTDGWQDFLQDCQSYPESLQECRQSNQWYYSQILELLKE